ncbi:hypothetical protein CMV_007751 [Castanea mollissima]|uniref:Uncharacterized protein n=1 Tax=Castanea mollissima TaxID=60419 RepID=A0A8J4RLA7_9ROSI|nr:hypothetical protein CMV_007751 [Castanea mollissima]
MFNGMAYMSKSIKAVPFADEDREISLFFEIMDSSQSSVLDNELSVVIVDQQEEDQVEPTHGSPSRSNTPSRHDKQNVEPRAFMVNLVSFREIVEEVKEMGFNPSRLEFALAVFVLRAMSKSTWEREVDVYKKWGLFENDIFLAFRRHPWCMMASEEKIMRLVDLLVNKMGMDSSLFIKRPGLVSLSLEKRLIPRGFLFQGFLSKGLVKKDFNIYPLFECPERTFVHKYIMPHKEEASELLKLYKEKMDSSKMRRE